MEYLDKKVPELRDICAALGLPKTGKKNDLILRLEQQQQRQQQQQQQQQQESFIKQETNEMQIDSVPIIQQQPQQQQQEVPTSPHVSGTGPSHEHIKYEYESDALLHPMNIEEIPTEDSSIEQNIPSNVEMSNEYPQSSIDPVEHQQKIDQPPTVSSSVATSPIVTQNDVKVEVPTNFEQNNHDQSKPSESLEKTSSSTYQKDDIRSEIKRELARLMAERKSLNSSNSKMFSRGIMMNQGQTNQGQTNQNKLPTYDYVSLLDIVKKSEIYNDGEIPEWLRYDYDTTLGTKKFGESEILHNIGIPAEDFFLPMPIPIVVTNVTN